MTSSTHKPPIHILYFTAEQWPTFRPDVVALFGKYLPRYGITSDLVTERDLSAKNKADVAWGGGEAILCDVPHNRAGQYLVKFWHNLRVLLSVDSKKYDAIQVRDMSLTALLGLLVARRKGIRFFYWLSFPQSEGQIDRAKNRGLKGGIRFWYPLLQGLLGKWLLYRIVLPRADHIFVQSRQMQSDIAHYGIPVSLMTAVPMGVDTEVADPDSILPVNDSRLQGKQIVAYLGTMDPFRQIGMLIHVVALVRKQIPDIFLLLVGDTEDAGHREWLKQESIRLGVDDIVLMTGWLPSAQAWSYVRSATIGLSPFPRGFLLDSASPTKAIEYMALGLPVIVNNNPDQEQVIAESAGGLCVPHDAESFAQAVLTLLKDPARCQEMGKSGKAYVNQIRNYDNMAKKLASDYYRICQRT